MPVWVGPISEDIIVGALLPDGRRVRKITHFPSPRALVSNHSQREWNRLHPEAPLTDQPLSEAPLRWAQVVSAESWAQLSLF